MQIRADDLDGIPCRKFVAQAEDRVSLRVAFLNDGANLPLTQIAGVLRKLAGLAVVKAGRIMAVRNVLDLVAPDPVRCAACPHVVEHVAVGSGDDGGIIGRFGAALDLQAVDPGVA